MTITRLIRRIVFGVLSLAVVGATVVLAVRPRPALVDMATVDVGVMDVRVEEDGKTRIREKYVVSTPLGGRLLRVTLDVGDEVKAHHTVLARMEPTDPELLDPRALAQAKARVRAAEQRLASAHAELSRTEAMLNFAETEMGRARQLWKSNSASEFEFAQKELEFRQRTEEARVAGFAVDIAEYELQLEKAALLLTDPDQRGDSEMELAIKAPIDGRVLRLDQESASVLTAGAALMEIGDPADLEIVADVLSRDAVRVSAGDRVALKHWGGDDDLNGIVRLVEPSGFTKISALGVEEQRVNVIIDIVDPPESRPELGDGFRVDCEVIVWESDRVLRIPTSALFRVDGDWHTFAVENSTARLTPVEIGHNNGEIAEVLGGLVEGAKVITHPSDSVVDGIPVVPR